MKTFLNVIGLLSLLGGLCVFIGAQSSVHQILGAIGVLTSCTALGLAGVISVMEKSPHQAAAPGAQSQVVVTGPVEKLPAVPGFERYYLAKGEDADGPYPIADLQALLERHVITGDSYVLLVGGKTWQRVSDVLKPE